MSKFVQNPIQFSADCVQDDGQCSITSENFLFLDNGKELEAIDLLQRKCGKVVLIPDTSNKEQALLYHTSCDRMTDAVSQLFQDALGIPAGVAHPSSEMTLGELYRRSIAMPYDDCKKKVKAFGF